MNAENLALRGLLSSQQFIFFLITKVDLQYQGCNHKLKGSSHEIINNGHSLKITSTTKYKNTLLYSTTNKRIHRIQISIENNW